MIFNSIPFLIFFVVLLVVYYLVKSKYRNLVLLIASYVFYAYSGWKNIFILIAVTVISYCSGLVVNKTNKKNTVIAVNTISILAILLYFKYSGFILDNVNNLFGSFFSVSNLVIPLGISFFTLQAITYPIDVYRKDVSVEKNIIRYALFVSFFPQILSGPIGKAKEMLPQFKEIHLFNYEQFKEGFVYIVHGLFKKIVIADLLAIGINNVYNNLSVYTGIPILITVFMYSLQIYFDFSSYSNIAYGVGKTLGFELNPNFNLPYLADSIKNFWARWHISLSTWFKDYLYIPLGGNRKGNLKTYINLTIVFIISGLWHGAAYTFIIWGGLHAIFQILERIFKLNFKIKLLNIIKTFLLVTFAWIFFRANSLQDAFYVITNMFDISFSNIKQQILSIGWDKYDLIVICISLVLASLVELLNGIKRFNKIPSFFQATAFLVVILCIVVFGSYGPGFNNAQFIYLGY